MMSLKRLVILATFVLISVTAAFAQTTPPPQTFGTTIYFDYTFNATNDGFLTGTDAAKALNNKFQFRRAYFTYENKISDYLKFRFRIDADNQNNVTSVDFKGSTVKQDKKMRPFLKHLYLDYAGLLPDSSLKIGMVDTLPFKLAEDRWGYRSVAKTLTDGYKDITGVDIRASSADLGLNFSVPVNRYLRVATMIVNGDGYSNPAGSKFKKFGGQVQLIPVAGLNIVGYAETEARPGSIINTKGGTANFYKVDLLFDMVRNLNISAEWFDYDNDLFKNADGTQFKTGGFSVFGTYKIVPDKLNVFARYDAYQPNRTNGTKDQSLIIIGLDWAPVHSSWKLQPNVWIYDYKDAARGGDAVVNLTFFLSF